MPSLFQTIRQKAKEAKAEKLGNSPKQGGAYHDGQPNSDQFPGSVTRTKSSSTVASSAMTPTPSASENSSIQSNGAPPLPQRPNRPTVNGAKRYSMNGSMYGSSYPGARMSVVNPSSLLAPRVLSISDGSWVNQQVLLIHGQIGESHRPLDGIVTVNHHKGHFPPTQWPVYDSNFKALIHLEPGWNKLRLDFTSPKVSTGNMSIPSHASWITINYLPLHQSPPLQLAIILGSDSPGTYDATPERKQREGNDLDMALRKFRTAAYLWQAFTGEQMQRHGFGRRCFHFEEAWEPGTLTWEDRDSGRFRTQAKIHVIRCSKTVAEIRDLDYAQQYDKAAKKTFLFDIAMEAVKGYFKSPPGQKRYVSCLFLDSHWDPKVGTVVGHAALGGGAGDIQLAIFGSHALQSYPASLEEVPLAFADCTRTDTAFVANDCNESGSNWEAANIGIGAHLHETGHLFGCPHQESGVMLRDYVTLNRTFTCREPYSTRTKSPGKRLVQQDEECQWHRLDALRFRFHACFETPVDPVRGDSSVQVWTVDPSQGGVIATSKSGLAWLELYPEGDDVCHDWIEWPESEGQYPRQVSLSESELRGRLPKAKRDKNLKIEIFSAGGEKHVVEDFSALADQKKSRVKLGDGCWGYRGSKLGYSSMQGSQPTEVILHDPVLKNKLLLCIRVWSGFALDGIEFIYQDAPCQLFGKRGGHASDFPLDTRKGELLIGFGLRAGLWIDGLQLLTNLGRKSEWYGNAKGGSGHTLIPPRGYTIGGISGSCGAWVDGFSLIITR